jgi:hypothetical protein
MYIVCIARGEQMIHISLRLCNQSNSSICTTMTLGFVSQRHRNRCQVSAARRWQLDSRPHLLQIACKRWGSKWMCINRRKFGIAVLPVTVLRNDTLTVLYPGWMTTLAMCFCPFTWRNLRLRVLFHDALFLQLHFVWELSVTQCAALYCQCHCKFDVHKV